MKTSFSKITKKDQMEVKRVAVSVIPALPKRVGYKEKEALLENFPGRFSKYSPQNIYDHLRLWQKFPNDSYTKHMQRSAAIHASTGISSKTKEPFASDNKYTDTSIQIQVAPHAPLEPDLSPRIIAKEDKRHLICVDCFTVLDLSKVYAVTPCADLVCEDGEEPRGHCLVFFESVRGTNTMVKVTADIAMIITSALFPEQSETKNNPIV